MSLLGYAAMMFRFPMWTQSIVVVALLMACPDSRSFGAESAESRSENGNGSLKNRLAEEAVGFSPFFYQKELDRATNSVDRLEAKLRRLRILQAGIDVELKAIAKLHAPVAAAYERLTAMSASSLAPSNTDNAIGESGEAMQERKLDGRSNREAMGRFMQLMNEIREWSRDADDIAGTTQSILSSFEQLQFEQSAGKSDDHDHDVPDYGLRDFRAEMFDSRFRRAVDDYDKVPFGTVRISAEAERKLEDTINVIDEFIGSLAGQVRRVETAAERCSSDIEMAISETSASREASVTAQSNARDSLKASYAEYQEAGSIDRYLVGAIVLMIVAMVALYFSLRLFKPEFAKTIIRHRLLIELLSMGFLLLTVIILGTARLLNAPALAALLGTMAGYIFARKPKRAGIARGEKPAAKKVGDAAGAPSASDEPGPASDDTRKTVEPDQGETAQ